MIRRLLLLVVVAVAAAACSPAPSEDASTPTGLTWSTVSGMEVPAADQGPRNRTEPAPTGYEHSQTGAALAAINAAVRTGVAGDTGSQTGQPEWAVVTRELIAPGRNKDWWIAQRARIRVEPADPAAAPRVVAYRVTSYNDAEASIDVYCTLPDRSTTVNHLQVAWTAGDDWGLVMPAPEEQTEPGANSQPRIQSVPSIPDDAVQLR